MATFMAADQILKDVLELKKKWTVIWNFQYRLKAWSKLSRLMQGIGIVSHLIRMDRLGQQDIIPMVNWADRLPLLILMYLEKLHNHVKLRIFQLDLVSLSSSALRISFILAESMHYLFNQKTLKT